MIEFKRTSINLLFLPLLALLVACADASTGKTQQKATHLSEAELSGTEIATFAGGCFWCTEAVFERVEGVKQVISGYSGGPEKNPTYSEVSNGETGHTESIQIYYDPTAITYPELLEIFFAIHDPITLNRQGPDVGKQYRSAIFYHDAEQQEAAASYMKKLESSGKYNSPIVTELKPFKAFYEAEGYHQDYYALNPRDPYVMNVAVPKINKFEKQFPEKLKEQYKH